MKDSRKRRILSAIGAVSCVISMIVSVAVLPAMAYANITRNPLFAAALAAVTENNNGQNKSGEGGAGKEAKGGTGKENANVAKGETAKKEDKGDKKTEEVDKKGDKKENVGTAKGETGKDNKVVDNKGKKADSKSPNGGSVDNSKVGKDAGKGAGKTADKADKKSGKSDKKSDKKDSKSGKGADKGKDKSDKANDKSDKKDAKKAAKKAAKKDGKDKKAKNQDRSAGLSLEEVKKLPDCTYGVGEGEYGPKFTIKPPYGHNSCAISAKQSGAFSAIRAQIKNLPDNTTISFEGGTVYGYGSLSKGEEGLFSGKKVSYFDGCENFDVSYVTDMSYLFKDSSVDHYVFGNFAGWDVSNVTNMEGMFEGCTLLDNLTLDDNVNFNWDVSNVTNMSNMFKGCTGLLSPDILKNWNVSSVTDMSSMFEGCAGLSDISSLSGWNTGSVTNMEGMFKGCAGLKSLADLSKWNVGKVTDMNRMFSAVITCSEDDYNSFNDTYANEMLISSLKPLKNWDVSNVTTMIGMFEGCTKIKDFTGLEKWKTKNVTSMNSMFRNCIHNNKPDSEKVDFITFKPLEKWDVSKVADMRAMFALCDNIGITEGGSTEGGSTEGLEKWNVSNVEHMDDMFARCYGLNNIKELANWNTKGSSTSKLTSTFRMFYNCNGITSLEPLKSWTVDNVENMHDMFSGCSSLTSLSDLASWKVDNVTDMHGMFSGCSSLTSLSDLASWKVDNVTDMHDMFNGCSGLKNLSGLEDWNVNNVTDMSDMFSDCYKEEQNDKGETVTTGLADISALSSWAKKVGKVTDMHGMFGSCKLLKNISYLKSWTVDNVTDMHNMFNGCSGLNSLSDLKDWNVGNVTNMSGMFEGCSGLGNLNGLEKWDVVNVKDMHEMFKDCAKYEYDSDYNPISVTGLTDISELKDWNVSKVEDMSSMFNGCGALDSIEPLSGWAVGNVTNMSSMFNSCGELTSIKPLSGWVREASTDSETGKNIAASNVSNVTDMSSMFADCKKLTGAADLSGWDISKVTDLSSMFSNAGAESGGFVLNFSNKTFNNSDDFSVDNMFKDLTGTIIATGWTMNGDNNPISSSMPKVLFGFDEQCDEDNGNCKVIQITDSKHLLVADSSVLGHLSKDKYKYYRDVDADIKPDDDSFPSNTAVAKFTFSLPAIYDSTDVEACKKPDENAKNNDKYDSVACAKAVLKKHFLGDFTEAIKAKRSKYPEITNIFSIWYYKKIETTDPAGSCTTDPKDKTPNCRWYTVNGKEGNGLDLLLKDAKSPVAPFNTRYYLEMLSRPVPLPHTGGQSAVMFTFLSIGLFSMFAVAGAFGRHGWVASVLPSTALTGFAKVFGGGALDVASGAKHCFAHSVAHSVVSGSMLKTVVSAATGFFARFRTDDSTFGKHTKQR